ncbi:hypothetical protein J2S10_003257 [Neobacillus ginsengisoli]|uniref:Transposase n=1 Tax=Neobacillus ginsengisoli TaxID=904295 RepID=A0ABT9XWX4_9BACI|nr:hypothetical protein [Neobacillus ginsengisoli]
MFRVKAQFMIVMKFLMEYLTSKITDKRMKKFKSLDTQAFLLWLNQYRSLEKLLTTSNFKTTTRSLHQHQTHKAVLEL